MLETANQDKNEGLPNNTKHADDITSGGTCTPQVDELEVKVPQRLDKYDLSVNDTKTEKYQIPKPPPPIPPKPSMETLLKHKNDNPL